LVQKKDSFGDVCLIGDDEAVLGDSRKQMWNRINKQISNGNSNGKHVQENRIVRSLAFKLTR
jgi:hypothetical protein